MLSRSISSRRLLNLRSLRAKIPTTVPIIIPRKIWYRMTRRIQYPIVEPMEWSSLMSKNSARYCEARGFRSSSPQVVV